MSNNFDIWLFVDLSDEDNDFVVDNICHPWDLPGIPRPGDRVIPCFPNGLIYDDAVCSSVDWLHTWGIVRINLVNCLGDKSILEDCLNDGWLETYNFPEQLPTNQEEYVDLLERQKNIREGTFNADMV